MEDNNLLFIKYNETKSKEDYEKLFLNNINLIRHIILKSVNLPLRTEKQILDEFIDVGYIGLTKAIKSYDINKMNETNFTSYAYKCIEYEIYRELKKRPPQLETNISLSSKINEEDDTDLEYFIGEDDKNFENIHSEEYKKYSKKLLEIIINSIPNQKNIEIIKMHYGLDGYKKMTYREIAKVYGCSHENIRIIVNKCLKSMREKSRDINKNNEGINGFDISLENAKKQMEDSKIRKTAYMNELLASYSMDEITNYIEKLNDSKKTTIKMYLGIGGYDKTTQKEIGKYLNIKNNYVSNYIKNCFKTLKKKMDKADKSEEVNNEIKDSSSVNEYEMFIDKYGKENVENAILKLSDSDQLFLHQLMNCNFSIKELIKIYNIKWNNAYYKKNAVFKRLEKIITYEKQTFYDRLVNIYGKEKLNEAILRLNADDQEFIKIFDNYNGSYSQVAKYYGISSDYVYTRKSKVLKRIKIAAETGKHFNNKKNLYRDFKNKYDEETIKEAITKLDSKDQEFMKVFYDLNCSTKKVADYYGISAIETCTKEKRIFANIENIIIGKNKDWYQSLYDVLTNIYGKEKLDEAILKLSVDDQEFIKIFDNYNGSYSQVAKYYGTSSDYVYTRKSNILKKIKIAAETGKHYNNKKNLYRDFKNKYDEETIKEAITKLDSKDQEFMKIFYDLNCSNKKTADYYKVSTSAICSKQKRVFANIENVINGVNKDCYQSLYDRLANIYGKEKLDEAILKLSTDDQEFIKIFDSFKGSCNEVAKYYGIKNNIVYTRKGNILRKIKIVVETGKFANSKKNIYNNLRNKYDEETIKEAITKLDSKDQEFMKVFYDLNCLTKKVADYYGKSESATCIKEKRIFKNIENIINGVSKDEYKSLYSELVDIYGKKELDKAIAKLSIKDQEFIKIFDSFNGSCSEVAKYYEINKNYVYKRKNDILRIIKTVIETGNYNNDKRNLYNSLKNKYNEETIKEAITKLDSKDQGFMKVFYDLNCSSREVAKYYGISASAIYVKEKRIFKNIGNIIDDVKENNYQSLYNELVNTYGKEALDEAILKLNVTDQKFIEIYDSFYGSCNEVAKYYGIEKDSVYTKKSTILKRIKIIIETGKRATSKKNLYNDLKDKYGEEAIKAAITKLKNKEQKFMNIFYENDCMISKVAKIYGRTLSYMSQLERKIFDNIENIINGNVKKYKLMENYDEETIKEAITKLNKKDQEFAKVIESFNGSYEKIADYYNVSLETMYSKKAALTKKIKKAIEIDEYKPKEENLYTKLSNKFNEEEIKKAILKLNDKDKEFMRVFYENNGSPTKISKYYGVSGPVVIKKEKRIFANIENIINGEKVDPFDKLVLEFGKDKVINSINALTSRSKSVMEDKYGLNGNSALSLNELKEKYNSNNDAIYAVIYYSLKRMKEYLTKSENTYVYLKKVLNSDSKENVKKALNDLSDDEKLIIWLYLGLDKEHKLDINKISKILNKTDDEVIEKINLIADKISKNLKKNINKK